MTTPNNFSIRSGVAFSFGLALLLAACGGQDEREYEADATDISEGELIVSTPTPGVPDLDLPETPMTPVPEDTVEADQMEGTEPE